MPTWLRIIILLVSYLTYIAFTYICICKKAKETKKNFLIITVGETVILILLMIVMFPNHIFFSYPDMLFAIGVLLFYSQISLLISKERQKCENNEEDNANVKSSNVENSNTADEDIEENNDESDEEINIEDLLKIIFQKCPLLMIGIIVIAVSVIFSTNGTTKLLGNNNIINPVQVSEDVVDIVGCYNPSVDLVELRKYGRNSGTSIGYVGKGKDSYYFWYFVQGTTGEICRSPKVGENLIFEKNEISDTSTNIQLRKITHDTIYTEIRTTSEKYKETITVESKYILNINPNEVVNVSE